MSDIILVLVGGGLIIAALVIFGKALEDALRR